MPNIGGRLYQVTAKLDRAKKHLFDLKIIHEEFVNSHPIEIQQAGGTFYVKSIKEPGAIFAATIGDIIQNLVSALDHLAYQLVCMGKNSEGPFNYVYFPFSENEEKYQKRKLQKLKGAKQNVLDLMDKVKPYKGGNNILWRLHELNNIDKHRLLITVGGAYNTINLGTMMENMIGRLRQSLVLSRETGRMTLDCSGPIEERFKQDKIDYPMKVKDRQFPLRIGAELSSGIECRPEDFTFYVAFGEPGFDDGNPMLEILGQMAEQVESIVLEFKPIFE
ncbi:MAG: hypothetical protein AB7T38_14530 [Nitrospirales bacterium]